jgi:type II secretory pathway pseudopilin PulG
VPDGLVLPRDPVSASRLRARLRHEQGMGLIELLAALALLTIAIMALLSAFSASIVSLTRAGAEGTALTVADRQMETYRAIPYACVVLNGGTAPTGCPAASAFPNPYSADQTPTSSDTPDHRTYSVHTDITSVNAKQTQVTVTVTDGGGKVRATQSSLFSAGGDPTP